MIYAALFVVIVAMSLGYFSACKRSDDWQKLHEESRRLLHKAELRIIDLEFYQMLCGHQKDALEERDRKIDMMRNQLRKMKGKA